MYMVNLELRLKKMSITSIVFAILFILIGLFLIIRPADALHLVSYAVGIIFLIWGLISMTKFFSKKNSENYLEVDFILGAFVFIFGIIILIKPDTIASIIPLLFGIWMLVNGVTKLSYSINIYREKKSFASIIVSLLIIICGVLLIFNPFSAAEILAQLIGISLIVYSILDLIECLVIRKEIKGKAKENQIIEAEFTEKKDE